MHIILGATGHIGSALAQLLLERGEVVTVILHTPEKAVEWQQRGAQTTVADVHDTAALRAIFQRGQRLFLLNPPAAPATDTAAEERRGIVSILAALDGSGLHKVVAESTYGAQPGERLGDLGVLYEMEQLLAAQPIPVSIIRAAYYLSNWDMTLDSAKKEGKVPSLYPGDFKLPMVAPADIAQVAARLLTEPIAHTGLHHVEGPEHYSAGEVAVAFAELLHRPVEVAVVPRDQWVPALRAQGFSAPAADSMARMTAATLDQKPSLPAAPHRGKTTLRHYLSAIVQQTQQPW